MLGFREMIVLPVYPGNVSVSVRLSLGAVESASGAAYQTGNIRA